MAKQHTAAAARKLGRRTAIYCAAGAILAAWWMWAVSWGQIEALIALSNGQPMKAAMRGPAIITQANAQESDREAVERAVAEAVRLYPFPEDIKNHYRLHRNDPQEYERQLKAIEAALIEALRKREEHVREQMRAHERKRRMVRVWLPFISEAHAQAAWQFAAPGSSPQEYIANLERQIAGMKAANEDPSWIAAVEGDVARVRQDPVPLWEKARAAWLSQQKAATPVQEQPEAKGPDRFLPPTPAAPAVRPGDFIAPPPPRIEDEARHLWPDPPAPESLPIWGDSSESGRAWLRESYAAEKTKAAANRAAFIALHTDFEGFAQGENYSQALRACLIDLSRRDPATFAHLASFSSTSRKVIAEVIPTLTACVALKEQEQAAAQARAQAEVNADPKEFFRKRFEVPPSPGDGTTSAAAARAQNTPKGAPFSVSTLTVERVRVWSLVGAGAVLALWLLMGGKWAILPKPALLPRRFFQLALPLVGVYALSFWFSPAPMGDTLWPAALAFLPPVFLFAGPAYGLAAYEWVKESDFYRETLVEGEGREVARMGGVREYLHRDITAYSALSRNGIARTVESPLYLGRTIWLHDYRLGGRDIGAISEQHMITVAGSGSGKSRDVIFNNLLQYSGGVLAFDMKGEHVRLAYERRKAYAPAYVIAPWDSDNALGVAKDTWNPLDEIDPKAPTARGDLSRMCEAVVVKEGMDSGNSAHFRETCQKVMRGYMAHVITAYPPEQRHLGTVYDLFKRGAPDEGTFNPEAVQDVVLAMADNPACGGAAADAAATLIALEDREKSGVISTLSRSLDWINDPVMRANLTKPSTFSLRDCKTRDASVFVVIPEKHLTEMNRYLRLLYQSAFDVMDEHSTPQPKGSRRRVLFLFDEFAALGHFDVAREAALRKRSSFIKCWYIVQNLNQFKALYNNWSDFLSNCDKQIFGLDRSDSEAIDIIRKGLGSYTETRGELSDVKPVMSDGEITEVLNADRMKQLFIPVKGAPMRLARVPYFARFGGWWQRLRAVVGAVKPRAL